MYLTIQEKCIVNIDTTLSFELFLSETFLTLSIKSGEKCMSELLRSRPISRDNVGGKNCKQCFVKHEEDKNRHLKLFSTIKLVYIKNLKSFQDNAKFPNAASVSEKGYARN